MRYSKPVVVDLDVRTRMAKGAFVPMCGTGTSAGGTYETCAPGGSPDYNADCSFGNSATVCGTGQNPAMDCLQGGNAIGTYYCENGSSGASDPNGCHTGMYN